MRRPRWFRELFAVALPPPAPPGPVTRRFTSRVDADAACKALNSAYAAHLNRWDGFFEVDGGDGDWGVAERHRRSRPRLGFDVARGGDPGGHAGF